MYNLITPLAGGGWVGIAGNLRSQIATIVVIGLGTYAIIQFIVALVANKQGKEGWKKMLGIALIAAVAAALVFTFTNIESLGQLFVPAANKVLNATADTVNNL